MVASCDGSIQALNDAARALFPFAELAPSLLTRCSNPAGELRSYLVRCSGSRQPLMERLTVEDWSGSLDFRCLGSVLVPRKREKPATVLLRLLPGLDARFTAGAERMRRIVAERRYRLALDRSHEALDDRTRLAKQHRLIAEALRIVEAQKSALDEEIQHIRAEERNRIAQDVHDQAGQELTMAIFELRRLRDATPGPARYRLDFVAQQLAEVGRRLHHAVTGGRPRIVEERGLAGAIESTLAAYAADAEMQAVFSMQGQPPDRLPEAVENALYRIAQEALTNAVKHAAGAGRLQVDLLFGPAAISLSITDDGAGITPDAMREIWTKRGLSGMRRRMKDIGGDLVITPGEVSGTVVVATIRLAPPATGRRRR